MVRQSRLSTYVPDRPPTWTEVGGTVLVLVTFGPSLQFGVPWWPAVAAGFVVFALGFGPVANTAFGSRISQWFREIGKRGRGTIIILFALTIAVAGQIAPEQMELLADAGYGGLAACVLYTALHIIVAGEISGWRTDGSRVDEQ